MIVPGKNLGTNGAGPIMRGESLDPFVWTDSRRSLRAACRLRRMMLIARAKEKMPKTPTLPPMAAANVVILCLFVFLKNKLVY